MAFLQACMDVLPPLLPYTVWEKNSEFQNIELSSPQNKCVPKKPHIGTKAKGSCLYISLKSVSLSDTGQLQAHPSR